MIDWCRYVGIPWVLGGSDRQGADCWGLVAMVYRDAYGIELEHYEPEQIASCEAVAEKVSENASTSQWQQIPKPETGDVVVMTDRKTRRPDHVGVFVGDGLVLHTMSRYSGQSVIHPLRVLERAFAKVEFYRHVSKHCHKSRSGRD